MEPPNEALPPAVKDKPSVGPAYNARSKNPNFQSISQEAMILCADFAQLKLSPKNLTSRLFPVKMINAMLYENTGELMVYLHLTKKPKVLSAV